MSVKFFGQFLIERGEIDSLQLREALALMELENRNLGQIAEAEGYLSEADAQRVNVAQRSQDRPFGQLAVEMKLLTGKQLEHVVIVQHRERIQLGDALVRLGCLGRDALSTALDDFKRDQAPYEAGRIELPTPLVSNWLASITVVLLPKLCMRVAQLGVKVAPGKVLDRPLDAPLSVSVHVQAEAGLEIALASDAAFARILGAGVTGIPVAELAPDLLPDAMGEFLNVLSGNAMGMLERAGQAAELAPPQSGTPLCEGHCFELVATEGKAWLVLSPV